VTKNGPLAYNGRSGQAATFTPVDEAAVTAELNKASTRARLNQRAPPPQTQQQALEEEPGAGGAPRPEHQTRQTTGKPAPSSASDSDEVSPGDSMPNRLTSRGRPCAEGPAMMKSAAGSPRPVSFGLIPQ